MTNIRHFGPSLPKPKDRRQTTTYKIWNDFVKHGGPRTTPQEYLKEHHPVQYALSRAYEKIKACVQKTFGIETEEDERDSLIGSLEKKSFLKARKSITSIGRRNVQTIQKLIACSSTDATIRLNHFVSRTSRLIKNNVSARASNKPQDYF